MNSDRFIGLNTCLRQVRRYRLLTHMTSGFRSIQRGNADGCKSTPGVTAEAHGNQANQPEKKAGDSVRTIIVDQKPGESSVETDLKNVVAEHQPVRRAV
jgi:hypothetical protein